ncbi:MAG TPA: ABC transporter ATP-binding protein [Acidimicrobiales bacterium]|nr:ABC transporter ATP-binding protein [Acidimicrobiales bacterium]
MTDLLSGTTTAQGARLDIEGATKHFGPKAALAGVHLHIDPGTFLVLLGPSGSGKTTLLRCLAGIERLSDGNIDIDGAHVASPGLHLPPEKRKLAMVFQDYALWPHMTAMKNVLFPLRQAKVDSGHARVLARAMLERVGLGHLSERYPNELSGGEQQRVALARALVGNVGLVLFDEPLSNLDADMREQLRLAISTLAREGGATSVYITHDQSEAFSLADKVGVLRDGRLVQFGTPEELYHRPASAFVARFTGICAESAANIVEPSADGSEVVEVRIPGHDRAVRATLARPVPPTASTRLFVRPSAVHLVPPGQGHFDAVVRDVAFAGRGYEHALWTAGGVLMTKVFCEHRWARNGNVGIRLSPEGCLVLPAAADDGPPSSEAAPGAGSSASLGREPARRPVPLSEQPAHHLAGAGPAPSPEVFDLTR